MKMFNNNFIIYKLNDLIFSIEKTNKKFVYEHNHPLNQNNISFKNIMNESRISKNDNYKFQNKSYGQDTTNLKEDKQTKCRRCSIF